MPDIRDQTIVERVGPIGQAFGLAMAIVGVGIGGVLGAMLVHSGTSLFTVVALFAVVGWVGVMAMMKTERGEVSDA